MNFLQLDDKFIMPEYSFELSRISSIFFVKDDGCLQCLFPVTEIHGDPIQNPSPTAEYPFQNVGKSVRLPENPIIAILQFFDSHTDRLKHNPTCVIL